ncbi:helix-turn-helix domain-containing protein [Microlunatus parietis]|uniref:DNA binding domain-containing protein, excisionase family n=1 Tax=Microlunatus parietis TaxID=682979 RepID=A0A7Y9I419_9ACTN|nr:helix-turn-helix domain-containing protein [Microlunatus parietis]NYE69484.1 hypothetical protein [Microlunatus parietis]
MTASDRDRLAEQIDQARRRMIGDQLSDEIAAASWTSLAELVGRRAAATVIDTVVDRCTADLTDDMLGPDRTAAYDAATLLLDQLAPPASHGSSWQLTPLGQAVTAETVTATSETVTVAQAAELLGQTPRKIRWMIKTGRLAADTTSGRPILAAVLDPLADQKSRNGADSRQDAGTATGRHVYVQGWGRLPLQCSDCRWFVYLASFG